MNLDLSGTVGRARAEHRTKLAARSLYKTHGALSRAAFQRQRAGLSSTEADRLVDAALQRYGDQGVAALEQALQRLRLAQRHPTAFAPEPADEEKPKRDEAHAKRQEAKKP